MQITRETLAKERDDLALRRSQTFEMLLRYDGALQAVESLIALCDKEEDKPEG